MKSLHKLAALLALGSSFACVLSAAPAGQIVFSTPGAHLWTAPAGVTSASVVCVGGGAGYHQNHGGGGGGLGWKNGIPVTPGNSYLVVVGAGGTGATSGGDSYLVSASTVRGGGANAASGVGGDYFGDGGGLGGAGGQGDGVTASFPGGGGAGGYSGNGGNGGSGISSTSGQTGTVGTGGGGGGGGGWWAGGGGGVGLLGKGPSGSGGNGADETSANDQGVINGGGGGSAGQHGAAYQADSGTGQSSSGGGAFGGGAGMGSDRLAGGHGAVRIIWGEGRAFPATNTQDITTAPAITSSLAVSAITNSPFTYQISSNVAVSSYTASGLPAGLTLNPNTGVISGSPTVDGTYIVAISAGTLTANLTLTVSLVYQLTVQTTTGGTVSGNAWNLSGDAKPIIVATPTAGYMFSGWSGGPATNAAAATTTVPINNANRTVTANFAASALTAEINMPTEVDRPISGTVTLNLALSGASSNATLTEYKWSATDANGNSLGGTSSWTAFQSTTEQVYVSDGYYESILVTAEWSEQVWVSEGWWHAVWHSLPWGDPAGSCHDNTIGGSMWGYYSYEEVGHYVTINHPAVYRDGEWIDTSYWTTRTTIAQLPSAGVSKTLSLSTSTPLGALTVVFTVRNSAGTTVSIPRVVQVEVPFSAPPPSTHQITSSVSAAVGVNATFGYQIAANVPVASYSALGLPPGLSLNPASGLISGMPTQEGVFGVIIGADSLATNLTLRVGNIFQLTVQSSPGGTAAGSSSELSGNAMPIIVAVPAPGYAFVGWSGGPVTRASAATTTVPMINADRTVTANFQPAALAAGLDSPVRIERSPAGNSTLQIALTGNSANATLTEYTWSATDSAGHVLAGSSTWTAFQTTSQPIYVPGGYYEQVLVTAEWSEQVWVSDGWWHAVWHSLPWGDPAGSCHDNPIGGSMWGYYSYEEVGHYVTINHPAVYRDGEWVDTGYWTTRTVTVQLGAGTAPKSVTVEPTTPLGPMTLVVTVRNAAGETATLTRVGEVVTPNGAPILSTTTVNTDSAVAGDTLTFSVKAQDPDDGLESLVLEQLTPGAMIWTTVSGSTIHGAASQTLSPRLVLESAGVYRFRVVATDSYGARTTSDELVVPVIDIPILVVMGGADQLAVAGQFNAQPFDIAVRNTAGTAPLVNSPVTFSVIEGGGMLAATSAGGVAGSTTLERVTDEDGTVQVFYRQPSVSYVLSEIKVAAGVSELNLFSLSTAVGDADGNGLQDAWEVASFGYAAVNSLADPDGDGLNNGQEYVRGTNPLDADTDGDGVSDGQEATEFRDPLQQGDGAALPTNCQLVIKLPDGSYKGVTSDWQVVPVAPP